MKRITAQKKLVAEIARRRSVSQKLQEVEEYRKEALANSARNALMFFSVSTFPKGEFDLKRSAGQFQKALALLADEENFQLADSLMDAWPGYTEDTDSSDASKRGRQFVRAAAAMGAAQLKSDEVERW
jgi:hypothetical protein